MNIEKPKSELFEKREGIELRKGNNDVISTEVNADKNYKKIFDELLESLDKLQEKYETYSTKENRLQIDDKEIEILVSELKTVFELSGYKYYEDVNDLYKKYKDKKMIVRRENPGKLIKSVIDQKPLEINTDNQATGYQYGNCAEWDGSQSNTGLKTAILEGRSHLFGLSLIEGFDESKCQDITIDKSTSKDMNLGLGLDRTQVRVAQGKLYPQEIEFILLRVPATKFPKNLLTEFEKDNLADYELALKKGKLDKSGQKKPLPFVLRGFSRSI